jgi:hypothetical protein
MKTSRAIIISAAIAAAAPAARAWDVQGADFPARQAAIQKAWKGKDAKARVADKEVRARQKTKPDWLGKSAWPAGSVGKSAYYYGVGCAANIRMVEIRAISAEGKATGAIATLVGGRTTTVDTSRSGRSRKTRTTTTTRAKLTAFPLDWYWDEGRQELCALVVGHQ